MMTSIIWKVFILGLLSIPIIMSSESKMKRSSEDSDESDSTDLICGGEFRVKTSADLNVPNNSNITRCEWILTTQMRKNIAIIFHSFNVDDKDNCTKNYVAVNSETLRSSQSMGVFCGNNLPPALRTYGKRSNILRITYVRNNQTPESGFTATVISIFDKCDDIRSNTSDFRINDKWNPDRPCGEVFGPTETTGIIQSPCFPGKYPRNQDCVWEIVAPPGDKIKVTFTHFHLPDGMENSKNESVIDCNESVVEVVSMQEGMELKNHGSLCGKYIPRDIISEGNSMKIIFKSSSVSNDYLTGFALEFAHGH